MRQNLDFLFEVCHSGVGPRRGVTHDGAVQPLHRHISSPQPGLEHVTIVASSQPPTYDYSKSYQVPQYRQPAPQPQVATTAPATGGTVTVPGSWPR